MEIEVGRGGVSWTQESWPRTEEKFQPRTGEKFSKFITSYQASLSPKLKYY